MLTSTNVYGVQTVLRRSLLLRKYYLIKLTMHKISLEKEHSHFSERISDKTDCKEYVRTTFKIFNRAHRTVRLAADWFDYGSNGVFQGDKWPRRLLGPIGSRVPEDGAFVKQKTIGPRLRLPRKLLLYCIQTSTLQRKNAVSAI